jgi:hypothetical protein
MSLTEDDRCVCCRTPVEFMFWCEVEGRNLHEPCGEHDDCEGPR